MQKMVDAPQGEIADVPAITEAITKVLKHVEVTDIETIETAIDVPEIKQLEVAERVGKVPVQRHVPDVREGPGDRRGAPGRVP